MKADRSTTTSFAALLVLALTGCIDSGATGDIDQSIDISNEDGLVASPAKLDFGGVAVGAQRTLPITITNASDVQVQCDFFQPSDPTIEVSQSWLHQLPPGDSITIDVTFAPTTAGAFTGDFSVIDGESQAVNLVVPVAGSAK